MENQNEQLAALALDAAAADAGMNAGAAQPEANQGEGAAQPLPEPEVLMKPEEEAKQIVELVAFAVEKIFPVLGYKDETKAEAARRITPLMVKYNLSGTVFGKWGAEIEAGMFFGGLIIASVQAVRAHKEAEEAKAEMDKAGWFSRFFKWGKA